MQAKESWEMDTKEKLEQAAIVKEKGTTYFKVCKLGGGGEWSKEAGKKLRVTLVT